MFEDNWYLFLLIVMIAFVSDGEFSKKETAVMLAVLAALAFTNNADSDTTTSTTTSASNCFCNKTLN